MIIQKKKTLAYLYMTICIYVYIHNLQSPSCKRRLTFLNEPGGVCFEKQIFMFQHSFCCTCGQDILHTHVSSHAICSPSWYLSQPEADYQKNNAKAGLRFWQKMKPYMPPSSYETAVYVCVWNIPIYNIPPLLICKGFTQWRKKDVAWSDWCLRKGQ